MYLNFVSSCLLHLLRAYSLRPASLETKIAESSQVATTSWLYLYWSLCIGIPDFARNFEGATKGGCESISLLKFDGGYGFDVMFYLFFAVLIHPILCFILSDQKDGFTPGTGFAGHNTCSGSYAERWWQRGAQRREMTCRKGWSFDRLGASGKGKPGWGASLQKAYSLHVCDM